MGDMAQRLPRIYVAMDNCQVEYRASTIQMEGKLCNQVICILINPSSNYGYISENLEEKC